MKFSEHTQSSVKQTQWEELVENTFDGPASQTPAEEEKAVAPAHPEKSSPAPRKWIWAVLAALVVVVIATVCILPTVLDAADTSIPEELIPCKQALDEWQALDNCKITCHIQRYTGSATSWYEEYWISGEDWILLHTDVYSSLSSHPVGYMYRDGQLYLSYNPSGDKYTWLPHESETAPELELWPLTFSWKDCELLYQQTAESGSSQTISFSVVDKNSSPVSPYHVQFQLGPTGRLQSVTVVQVRADMTVAMDTYLLSRSNDDAVAQYIEGQFVGKILDTDIDIPE